jgi:tripartite ATP-independent transporter DctM subunit
VILLFGVLAVLFLIGAPVFVALAGASLTYLLVHGIPPLIAVQQTFAGIDKFPLLAVPFFILAGNLMNAAAITDRLFAFARALVGHFPGGLGHVNITASLIFSGMSGTAVADAGGLGTVELKAMRDQGYDDEFAIGITASSSTIGPIIPPSLAMIVYGLMANVSVGRLFVAGVVPGLLMALALHLLVLTLALWRGYPREKRASLRELGSSFQKGFFALFMPVIIVGGIVLGVVTPTEAAIVAVLYALLIGFVVYRSLGPASTLEAFRETFETTAVIMIMVGASVLFGWILVRENVASQFTRFMLGVASEPWQAMLMLNVILLISGMFMETIAVILILTPIVTPVLQTFAIDPVQFGVVMVLNLMIGLMTPPIGLLLFVMARLGQMDLFRTTRACLPFMLPLFVVLLLASVVPEVTLALPRLVFR